MNIEILVKEYLTSHGYTGLYDDDGECACCIDDLMPCGIPGNIEDCEPGYQAKCHCGDHDWHIQKTKPRGRKQS